ncbi:hypothetical protein B0919_12845 [Hymenobacter sp. CRA2]|nr:hypothetical protein B0919_12845 [Hymenobacter sp. CRA2]
MPTAAAAPPPVHHAHACLNCGAHVADRYCGHCGQDGHTHRFTLGHLLLHDLPHSVWHVDKGLPRTLWQLVKRPGSAITEYLAGRRASYFSPLSYLLLLAGLSALLMSAIHLNPYAAAPDTPRLLVLTMERYLSTVFKYPSATYVLLLPLNALLSRWLLKPTGYNYAEMLISQAFIAGTLSVLAMLLMVPLVLLFVHSAHFSIISQLPLLLSLGYPAWVYRQLLEPAGISAAGKWTRAVLTSALQLLVMFVAALVFMVYLAVTLARQDPSLLTDFQARMAKQQPARPTPPVPRP